MTKRQKWYREEYLKSEHWQAVRERSLELAGHKCQLCAGKDKLNVHHNNYDNLWNEKPSDVVVLCEECHEVFHSYENDKRAEIDDYGFSEAETDNKIDEWFYLKCDNIKNKYNLSNIGDARNGANEIMRIISVIPDPVLKSTMRKRVAELFGVAEGALNYSSRRSSRGECVGPASTRLPLNRRVRAEYQLASLVCRKPDWARAVLAEIGVWGFVDALINKFMERVDTALASNAGLDIGVVVSLMSEDFAPEEVAMLMDMVPADDGKEQMMIDQCAKIIKTMNFPGISFIPNKAQEIEI